MDALADCVLAQVQRKLRAIVRVWLRTASAVVARERQPGSSAVELGKLPREQLMPCLCSPVSTSAGLVPSSGIATAVSDSSRAAGSLMSLLVPQSELVAAIKATEGVGWGWAHGDTAETARQNT